jgi:hypothetical protein
MCMTDATTPAPYAALTIPAPAGAERPTEADALCQGNDAPTWPPLSANRAAGVVWYCELMARATSASNDVARFAAGL